MYLIYFFHLNFAMKSHSDLFNKRNLAKVAAIQNHNIKPSKMRHIKHKEQLFKHSGLLQITCLLHYIPNDALRFINGYQFV